MRHFNDADWIAAGEVPATVNGLDRYSMQVGAAEGRLPRDFEIIHTPGHTLEHYSLLFKCDGLSVIVAGDAAMTRDFWKNRMGYFNSKDLALAVESIDRITALSDVIIPGHDNCFAVRKT